MLVPLGATSYLVAAAAFGGLALLLSTRWRGRISPFLTYAAWISVIWASICAAYYTYPLDTYPFAAWRHWYLGVEVVRSAAWLCFLVQGLRPLTLGTHPLRGVISHYFYPGLGVFVALQLALDGGGHLLGPWGSDLAMMGHIATALVGLVLIEQLFRNTRVDQRWAVKHLYLGIGALFAYDFFLYTDALLFRRIDGDAWFARGLANAVTVPLIALAAVRRPHWSLDSFVSRRVVIHSATLLGAGCYLAVMGAAGYAIRFYGGTWGPTFQLAFLFAAGLLLLIMMFSGQVRASIKRFLNHHFFRYRYDYREEWLKFNDLLFTAPVAQDARQRAIRAVAEMLGSSGGALWTATGSHFALKALWNFSSPSQHREPIEGALALFLAQHRLTIDLREVITEPEFYRELTLPDWLSHCPRSCLVVPLLRGDTLGGFLVLAAPRAQTTLTGEDRDLLRTAGQQVAIYAALLDTTEALMDARQFDAFHRLAAFVVHDLKNVSAQLSLVVANAQRHRHNPAFVEDAFDTVQNATTRMNRLLAQLNKGADGDGAPQVTEFPLEEALEIAIAHCCGTTPVPEFVKTLQSRQIRAPRERFISVVEHLLRNAQEATADDGFVHLACHASADGGISVEIADNGCGMDEAFIRDKLFRPFNTTKGNAGMGLGVYEAREFVTGLGGEIEVTSHLGSGTSFYLKLPPSAIVDPSPAPETPCDCGDSAQIAHR
ncbi:MAG: XrtA/PEP-CTERM system histidine kinase PrsK [Candidatus Competibacterales bacterium]